ncbi:MAG: cell shape-determining protein MreC [Candidatus Sericytochromatia bacterium]|nr:MAG: cell shape-determining protein MreC [Candidatus Sericytochromatia bacterium]
MKSFYKDKNTFFIVFLVIVSLSIIYLNRFVGFTNILQNIYYPFGKFIHLVNHKIYEIKKYFNTLEYLTNENIKLKKEIENYNLILQDYEEVIKENNRIRKILNFKLREKKKIKFANVIGKSPDIWHKELMLDIGKNQNIKINDSVISYNSLIGRVKEINDNSCKVQTISDPSVWVSIQNNRSRSVGMLKSESNNKAKLYYLNEKSDFKISDLIVTSGLGGLYPKGIPIGLVSKVNKVSGDLIPEVYVDLLENFDDIEEVIIISND